MLNDHININQNIMIRYSIKSLRIMIQIILSGYFTWLLIYILFDISNSDFFTQFELEEKSTYDLIITFWYFSFTTITTVGLGDYYPVSNFDRLFFSFYILAAVLVFSVVMSELDEVLRTQLSLSQDITDDEGLQQFMNLLRRFNYDNEINPAFRKEMFDYFRFKWSTDRNQALITPED